MDLLEWLTVEQICRDELIQAGQEGKDVSSFAVELEQLVQIHNLDEKGRRLQEFYQRLSEQAVDNNCPYYEPSELAQIRSEAPSESKIAAAIRPTINNERLFDAVYGAWLGRCAGCLLGKPVEGMTNDQIQALLTFKDAFPLNFYIAAEGGLPANIFSDTEQPIRYDTGVFENVLREQRMLRDDDIDFAILGLTVLEDKGCTFASLDVGAAWLQRMPLLMTYTAERVAYRNMANGVFPPHSAQHYNPYREWIGAQIRADIWGFVCPGEPSFAAELAFRDAQVSHQKNGIYGEMFIAAAIAAAFETPSILQAIECGLTAVPQRSRFAEMVRTVITWSEADADWRLTFGKIMDTYGHYDWFHTIPNAAVVIMALLHAPDDFEKAITIAVMAGLDTDCNGATVGSILGAHAGASQLPEKWIKPLNDRVASFVAGEPETNISTLAQRTLAVIDRRRAGKET